MALLTAPLMSLDASGTIAKTLVFSKWKGRNYVRQHVIPANPQSPLQVADRASLAFLSQAWKNLSTPQQATWKTLADAGKFSEFNAYLKTNQRAFANFDPPAEAAPPVTPVTGDTVTALTATVDNTLVAIAATIAAGADTWGILLCLSDSAIAACTRALVVKEMPATAGGGGYTAATILGPLKPGNYHINARAFSSSNGWGPDFGDVAFTIT